MNQPLSPELFTVAVTPMFAPGYVIKFTAWENDGDDYSTQQIAEIQTKQDVDFYIALAEVFTSRNNRSDPGMGNEEPGFDQIAEVVAEILEAHPDITTDLKEEINECIQTGGSELYAYLCDNILGHPVAYEYGFCRVVERVEVQLIQPMVVAVEDRFFR